MIRFKNVAPLLSSLRRQLIGPTRLGVVALTAAVAFAACASSTDPDACNSKGSYPGADTCGKLKAAWDAKCGAVAPFDCSILLAGTACNPQKSFCKEGVDKLVSDINGAPADCSGIKANVACF